MDSARVANHDATSRFPDFNFISQGYEYGNDLAVEADLSVKLSAEIAQGYLTNTKSLAPQASSFHYAQLCTDTYPKGAMSVQIRELCFDGECMAGGLETVNGVVLARAKLSRERP